MKIVFCGTHSTGKTTVATQVAQELSIPFVSGPTRKVPKELRGTAEGQLMILAAYMETFPKVAPEYICDRSFYDIIAYSMAHKVWTDDVCDKVARLYSKCSFYPDLFIYLPIEFDVVMDADRPEGDELRKEVDRCVYELLRVYAPHFYTVQGTPAERVSKVISIFHRHLPDFSSDSSLSRWSVAEPGSSQEHLNLSEQTIPAVQPGQA